MTEQQTIDKIRKRIQSEYAKHKTHNWTAIAAAKIYAEFVKQDDVIKAKCEKCGEEKVFIKFRSY